MRIMITARTRSTIRNTLRHNGRLGAGAGAGGTVMFGVSLKCQ